MTRPAYRRMVSRRPDEDHRAATPLELFFDLCFVVAVALAAGALHHDLSTGRVGHGIVSYLMVFFAIWWAWMNFTWFASAYDTDDDLYRLTTLVQIAGALVLAAGVPRAFKDADFEIITYGYVLMRLAMVVQWLRAAHGDPERRATDLRYALGVSLMQIGWLVRLGLPDGGWRLAGFWVLVVAELAVPIWAERRTPTTWHPRHVAERYGLFTLIVLGESVLAATTAVQAALSSMRVVVLAGAGLVIVFSMWWLYFDRPAHDRLTSLRKAIFWGYGHYLVFASAAAVGAGLAVAVDRATGHAQLSAVETGYTVAVPVAVFVLSVWILHARPERYRAAFPVAAALILVTPFGPAPTPATALVMAALVAVVVVGSRYRGGWMTATPQKSL